MVVVFLLFGIRLRVDCSRLHFVVATDASDGETCARVMGISVVLTLGSDSDNQLGVGNDD